MSLNIELNNRKNFAGGSLQLAQGVNVLVGENGSGKSSVLESVFRKITESNVDGVERVVGFSSGPNQNFNEVYDLYRARNKGNYDSLKQLNLKSFLFQQEWAPVLICLAAFTSTKESPSLVSKFLSERQYVIDELFVKMKVGKNLIDKISSSLQVVEKDKISDYDIRSDFSSSTFIQLVEKISGQDLINLKRGFTKIISITSTLEKEAIDDDIVAQSGSFISSKLYTSLIELTGLIGNTFNDSYPPGSTNRKLNTVKLVAAFALGALNDSIFDISQCDLVIRKAGVVKDFRSKYLSDGEFQLLMTYAIIDLFDDSSTLFVMDEVDSHVHQQIIPVLWSCFNTLKGFMLTTTHNPTSLKYSDFTRVMAIKAGVIQTGYEFTKQLSSIFDCKESENRILCLGFRHQENLIVIDGYKDWVIFNELAKVKMGTQYDERLELNTFVYQVSSSQDVELNGNNAKISFIKKMENFFFSELTDQEQRAKKLRKVVFLYDRDSRFLNNRYKTGETYQVVSEQFTHRESAGPHNISAVHFFWHFREIENYLLIPEILQTLAPDLIIGKLGTTNLQVRVQDALTAINSRDDEYLAQIDCKDFITSIIKRDDGDGIDFQKLKAILNGVSPESISPYLAEMHNRVSRELFA